MFDDTIAAIATPLGEGGLAVIRISGADVLKVADAVFKPVGKSSIPSKTESHTILYGYIVRGEKRIDEVLLSVMRAPRTFTREDVVEISCHGGILVAKLVLDVILENGGRIAEPGEFSKRAFLNGRIDLAQAEAISDLIHARTELALSAANEQLAGKLSHRINLLRDDMVGILAHVEAYIDFPDEDIAPDTKDKILQRLESGVAMMTELLDRADEGRILRRGIRAAIIGRPNAGKSSLLNQLLGHDRAIVTPIAGTTRDTIEETANIRGIPVVFIDTAGLRESTDEIEMEGIRRSHQSLDRAELIIHVIDASEPFHETDAKYLRDFAAKKRVVVLNKCDLHRVLELPDETMRRGFEKAPSSGIETFPSPGGEGPGVRAGDRAVASLKSNDNDAEGTGQQVEEHDLKRRFTLTPNPSPPGEGSRKPQVVRNSKTDLNAVVELSCKSGDGIERLKGRIKEAAWSGEIKAEMLEVMINSRHQDALKRGRAATQQTIDALKQDLTIELAAMDLRIAVNAIGEIVGKTSTEDLLDSIFSQFCIGK